MSVSLRSAIAATGPRSGASWFNGGENVFVASPGAVLNGNTFEAPLFQVPPIAAFLASGAYQDALAGDNIEITLNSAWLAFVSTFAPAANFVTALRVYRAGALVGAASHQNAAGWLSQPSLAAFTPTLIPWFATGANAYAALIAPNNQALGQIVATPAQITAAALLNNTALLPLQPLDVVTLFYSNGTGGSVTPPGVNVLLDMN